ncbi:efflux RND transporter permease subunit [Zavarzinella formosa]|uniref:efflux RND transporter permease subunit n=1 Tax=Zavarzinella formosa TaxID=360055 RepID=UPI00030D666B|nr:efflux RND transporter permease subunit [Zavarzinella formosa]
MNIWDLCIRRPVFTAMLVSAPIVLGIVSYTRLGVELFPNVDMPMITVTTTLRGASVEAMETSVTKPIEEAVNTISSIDELRSSTKEGFSQVVVQFKLDKNGDIAAQEVDAKVRTILSQLPVGTDPPIIDKLSLDATPVMTIVISGNRDMREITEIARKRLKEELETTSGVGSVVLVGGRPRAVHVIVDPDKLAKYENLTIEDVRQALIRENREDPGGRVDRLQSEKVLRVDGRVDKSESFGRLIIGNRNGQPIRIEDVGRVDDSFEEPRGMSRLWMRSSDKEEDTGRNAVSIVIQKQSGRNTVTVVDELQKRMEAIKATLPPDIRTEVIRDQSRFIRISMEEVKIHLLLAVALVSLSILLFLRDWRTTIIATLAIPTSLIGSFAFMYAMGFTLNNFTMIGLILSVGIVVDDAVVVHENIFRHMEEKGLSAFEAASSATKEIALAVVATTLSLVVVFAPIAFMGGQVGRFFNAFGYVVGFSVLMSMFISFTMTPALCSRFLKKPEGHGSSKSGFIWNAIEKTYIGMLAWSLRHRWVVITTAFLVFLTTPVLMSIVGADFVPKDDQSEYEMVVTFPEGYSLERADQTILEIDRRIRKLRGVEYTFSTIGDTTGRVTKAQGDVTKGNIYVRLTDLSTRKFSQFDIMNDTRNILKEFPDLRTAVQDVSIVSSSGFREVDVDLNLCGPDMAQLQKYSNEIADWMRTDPRFVDVDTSLSLSKPELRVRPDSERLSDLGVSLQSVSATTNVLVGGLPVTKYKEKDEEYDVWLRAEHSGRDDRETISRLGVPSTKSANGVVKIGSVARFEDAMAPNTIDRFGRQRQVVISSNLKGLGLSDGVALVDAYMKSREWPPEYRYEFIGRAKMLKESNDNFLIGFLLAFVFMYMILAAQFDSFVHPVSILAALPLTIPFAIVSLIMLRTPLDLFAMLGLFMLFGIVKKNGILQVDYTNHLRKEGMERTEAILEANRVRLRPILMTTVMLVAAMIPMALGQGPGAGSRSSMAKVILGGQALSLALTLLVTPVSYSIFDGIGGWWRRQLSREKVHDEALAES